MGNMNVLDETGHTRIIWDVDKGVEVDAARKLFDTLRAKNYVAYRVKDNGSEGEVIKHFDSGAEKLILHAPIVGG